MRKCLSTAGVLGLLLVMTTAGRADAYGGPTTIPGSTPACTATMQSYARYGTGVFETHAITENKTGCTEVRVRLKFDANHFGPWVNGGSRKAEAITADQAIGGSHQRCITCATGRRPAICGWRWNF